METSQTGDATKKLGDTIGLSRAAGEGIDVDSARVAPLRAGMSQTSAQEVLETKS